MCVLHNSPPPLCIKTRRGTFKSQWQWIEWGEFINKTDVIVLLMFKTRNKGEHLMKYVHKKYGDPDILVTVTLDTGLRWPGWCHQGTVTFIVRMTHSLHANYNSIITGSSNESSRYQDRHQYVTVWHCCIFHDADKKSELWTRDTGPVWVLINCTKIFYDLPR